MEPPSFKRADNVPRNPLQAAKFQKIVRDFMIGVRSNDPMIERETLDRFCHFIDHKDVWHLAQMVVPEFRLAKTKQERDPNSLGKQFELLDYVLSRLSLLPAAQHPHILTNEEELLRQRLRNAIIYVETGGGQNVASQVKEDADQLVARAQAIRDALAAQVLADPSNGDSDIDEQTASTNLPSVGGMAFVDSDCKGEGADSSPK